MEDRIKDLECMVSDHEKRISVTEVKVDNVKEDIKEIKEGQSKIIWWIIGTMGTSLISLLILIVNMLRG
jgi:hypothetical protein